MRTILLSVIILFCSLGSFAQRDTDLVLNRFVYSYDLPKNSHRKLPAVDFKTDSVQFTIAIFDADNDSILNSPNIDMVIVAPYKADSVYTHVGCQAALISFHEQDLIQVKNREYRITCTNVDENKIHLHLIRGNYFPPDAMLFDHLPQIGVTMLSGKRDSLPLLADKSKYTYVLFWGTWCQSCTQSLTEMKSIYAANKNSLTVIGMDFNDIDTTALRKYVKAKGYTWPQVISNQKVNEAFSQTGYPYGVLFAPGGNLIKQGMTVKELKAYLNNHR
ncbi:MAG TPA: TlpA disulfide reductase family protein [Bacteroidia bacterium]|jgi:thiol-disulfide isomerase/thioredoxin|nr:TlpA disulfide reductase family protein [Bacteroidia bacterium]